MFTHRSHSLLSHLFSPTQSALPSKPCNITVFNNNKISQLHYFPLTTTTHSNNNNNKQFKGLWYLFYQHLLITVWSIGCSVHIPLYTPTFFFLLRNEEQSQQTTCNLNSLVWNLQPQNVTDVRGGFPMVSKHSSKVANLANYFTGNRYFVANLQTQPLYNFPMPGPMGHATEQLAALQLVLYCCFCQFDSTRFTRFACQSETRLC